MISSNPFKNLKSDFPASIVVFFVALPLCLGIALASGASPFSGLIAGIVGGVVVGILSKSNLGVSGPAAGLVAIVLVAIETLGSFEKFLVAVVIAGAIQILLGISRAGIIGYFFPSSVIKGMLTAIGIIIILKQIPHFFGYDRDPEGDFSFNQADGENTFTEILKLSDHIGIGATIIGVISLLVLLLWSNVLSKKGRIFELIQGPLVVVVLGILYFTFTQGMTIYGVGNAHLVSVPVPENVNDFLGQFKFPDFSAIKDSNVWISGFTIALVASLETLLCVEATDKLDPYKRVTPTNRELVAQGAGNMIAGFLGGLPITQVIVRSSANIQSGGKTKMSAILHGFFLLASVILIPFLLNKIPLSVLAAILILVGYKLARPAIFIEMFKAGWMQFVPFIITVFAIVLTDLLIGIGVGLAVGIFLTLYRSFQNSHFLHKEVISEGKRSIKMTLAEEVTFFNKATILKELDALPENSSLELDVRNTKFLDYDIIEILVDFAEKAKNKNIEITLFSERGTVQNPTDYRLFFQKSKKESLLYENTH